MAIEHRLLAPLKLDADPATARLFESCALPAGRPLPAARRPASAVHFLASGVVSMTSFTAEGRSLDVAMIGRDGFTGAELVLGNALWNCRLAVQAPCRAWRIAASDLQSLMRSNEEFRIGLLRYAGEIASEIVGTALACCHGNRTERVARWIALMQEHLGGDTVETTHDVIAAAIGAHRPGVTAALHLLEERRLVRLGRGRVRVIDKAGLAAAGHLGDARRTEPNVVGPADSSLSKVS